MSLNGVVAQATSALVSTQYKISVANANVANASETGYSRKVVSTTASTASAAISSVTLTRAADAYLARSALKAQASSAQVSVIDTYLQSYDAALGSTTEGDDVASLVSSFQTALTALAASPDSDAAKSQVVADAVSLAGGIKTLSGEIQSLRTEANRAIGDAVDQINATLETLESLNNQIVSQQGADTTDLEDQRDAALSTLSGLIGVSTYTDSSGRVAVYTSGGDQLLGATAATLAYDVSSTLGADVTYPDQISAITINGKDVTSRLEGGTLGGLVDLRDDILPDQQARLDALAQALTGQVNAATADGTAYPAPNSLTGVASVSASDPLSASGSVRLAVTASDGKVVSAQDIDLSAYATVGDLVSGLDAIDGLSASLDAQGRLVLTADDSSNGVAVAALDSDIGGQSFSAAFGLNALFTGTDASDIGVSPALKTDASGLPTGVLASGALAAGDTGLSISDTSTLDALSAAFTASISFPAAGGFAAGTATLSSYATKVVSGAASVISQASSTASSAQSVLDQVQTRLSDQTGVNMDEELANLTLYQNQYEATAQLVSIAKSLFDALISMVN